MSFFSLYKVLGCTFRVYDPLSYELGRMAVELGVYKYYVFLHLGTYCKGFKFGVWSVYRRNSVHFIPEIVYIYIHAHTQTHTEIYKKVLTKFLDSCVVICVNGVGSIFHSLI